MHDVPRIADVAIDGKVLIVRWQQGGCDRIDLSAWLSRPGPPEFAILNDPAVLARPLIAGFGTVVAWDEDGDVGIDSSHLRQMAQAQTGAASVRQSEPMRDIA